MHKAVFTKDLKRGVLRVERLFDAAPEKVWTAHTKEELLGQWWAPAPWKAVTVSLDFREGGKWFYYMLGPEGERHYCTQTYEMIEPGKSFTGEDYFCNETGAKMSDMPVSHWKQEFIAEGSGTRLISTVTYPKIEDLQKVIEMGMEEGYTMGLNQLEALLSR